MAMEQRARFHPNATKGIKEAQKIYAAFIEEMKEKTKEMRNLSKTPKQEDSKEVSQGIKQGRDGDTLRNEASTT